MSIYEFLPLLFVIRELPCGVFLRSAEGHYSPETESQLEPVRHLASFWRDHSSLTFRRTAVTPYQGRSYFYERECFRRNFVACLMHVGRQACRHKERLAARVGKHSQVAHLIDRSQNMIGFRLSAMLRLRRALQVKYFEREIERPCQWIAPDCTGWEANGAGLCRVGLVPLPTPGRCRMAT